MTAPVSFISLRVISFPLVQEHGTSAAHARCGDVDGAEGHPCSAAKVSEP